jgi:hypothetical protein
VTEPPRQIKFLYAHAPEYRVVPATGAHGGVTPTGHIKMDLFVEYTTTPLAVTYDIAPGGGLGEESERDPSVPTLTREMQIGVLLTPDDAEAVSRWLLDRAAAARKAIKGP